MKRILVGVVLAATALSASVAGAQPYGGPRGDWDRYGRPTYQGQYDYRGWERGRRLPPQAYVLRDYGQYSLGPPPRGYAYYRTDAGDIVLAAIVTGIISSVILNGYGSGPSTPYYTEPYYSYNHSYGYR